MDTKVKFNDINVTDSRNTVTSKTSRVSCGDVFKLIELLEYVQLQLLS